jgi:Co/Zn/Cd efflux system component
MKDTLLVLMEGLPRGINFNEVQNVFGTVEGVVLVHNLRIWSLSMDKMALAAHLVVKTGSDTREILREASRRIRNKYSFFEMTLQIEDYHEGMNDCTQCENPST